MVSDLLPTIVVGSIIVILIALFLEHFLKSFKAVAVVLLVSLVLIVIFYPTFLSTPIESIGDFLEQGWDGVVDLWNNSVFGFLKDLWNEIVEFFSF